MTGDTPRRLPNSTRAEIEQELSAHLATLRDLGPGYTDTVASSFADRVEQIIDDQVRVHLKRGGVAKPERETNWARVGIAISILGLSIPLLAIAGGTAGFAGVAVIGVVLLIVLLRI